jgi:uncharacterized membrane protein
MVELDVRALPPKIAEASKIVRRAEARECASLVNVIPLIGVILLWTGFRKPAGWLLLIFCMIPLVIGGYEHFVKSSPDNVFQMAPGEFTLPFQVSAVLLVIFEILVCWASIRILKAPSPLVEKRQVNLG